MKIIRYFRYVLPLFTFVLSGCVAASIVPETAGDLRTGTPVISPALQQKQTEVRVLKRKVAIGRFTNETKYGNSFFKDDYGDRVGKQAMRWPGLVRQPEGFISNVSYLL